MSQYRPADYLYALVFIVVLSLFCAPVATAQTWIELHPTGGPPPSPIFSPKPIHYDSATNRLIAFIPGNTWAGGFGNQVWILTHANGLGGTPAWSQLQPTGTPPHSNGQESVVYDRVRNRLIVYGGCYANCSPALSQVFVLSHANGLGGTPSWSQSATVPSQARSAHSAVLDAGNDLMIAFGGHLAFFGTDTNDTRVLTHASGTSSPSAWSTLAPVGAPPVRNHHSAVYDAVHNRMTVFAGSFYLCCPNRQIDKNDVWVLEHANGLTGTPTWSELVPVGTLPIGRIGHSAVYDPVHGRMFVFAGANVPYPPGRGSQTYLGDLWRLDHANGLGGIAAWTQLVQQGDVPGPRFNHTAAFDAVNQRMIVLGGRDPVTGPSNRVWVLAFTRAVVIDVKPGSDPNSINPRSKGVVPVAILTTSIADGDAFDFDAWDADAFSLGFGPAGAGIAHAGGHAEDVDADGDLDMVVHFRIQESGIACGDTEAALIGETFTGESLEGSDAIRTVGCK